MPPPPLVHPLLWLPPAELGFGEGKRLGFEQALKRATTLGEAARQRGGYVSLTGVRQFPAALVALDYEPIVAPGHGGEIAAYFEAFHREAPGVRVTTYGMMPGGLDRREDFIAFQNGTASPEIRQRVRAWENEYDRAVRAIDAISPDCYMLGPNLVDRDLEYVRAVFTYLRQRYPGKPIYAWAWGDWHPGPHNSWNPPNTAIPDSIVQRMIEVYRNVDGVIAWGEYDAGNRRLLQLCLDELNR